MLKLFQEVMDEYEKELKERKKEIKPINVVVTGVGGAGNNTIYRLAEMRLRHAKLYAINTDIQQLVDLSNRINQKNEPIIKKIQNELETAREKLIKEGVAGEELEARLSKIEEELVEKYKPLPHVSTVILGREVTNGKGAGGDPYVAMQAAEESSNKIEGIVADADLVFITCGEGGGTGTGAAPIIAKKAKEVAKRRRGEGKEPLVISVVTMPFSNEQRYEKAIMGVHALKKYSDIVLRIENDNLLNIAGNKNIEIAFKFADTIVAKVIKNLTETINEPSLINIDFNDVATVMKKGGFAIIGIGESDSKSNRAAEVITQALSNKLMNAKVSNGKAALVHFTIGDDVTLKEVNMAVDELRKYLDPSAEVFMGARIDPELRGMIRAIVIISGIEETEEGNQDLEALGAEEIIEKYLRIDRDEEEKYDPLSIFTEL